MSKKTLPTINSPTLICTLPVSGIKIKYRPFIVREQKALLLAQESEDDDTIRETVRSVLESCTSGTLDYLSVPTADIAYFFLQLRIASVSQEVKFGIHCQNCDEELLMNFDLSTVGVSAIPDKNVMITDTVGITFRFPTIQDSLDIDKTDPKERAMVMFRKLLVSIFDENEVYDPKDFSAEELDAWIEGLNDDQMRKIEAFIDSIPELKHELSFTCHHCGHQQSRTLEGLHTFFRFGDDA